MRSLISLLLVLAPGVHLNAQHAADTAARVTRHVRGDTLISTRVPAAQLIVSHDFRYVGAQVVNLYGNALAEQHLFAKAGPTGAVDRFIWFQFEHFLPTNSMTYDYRPVRTMDLGGLSFVYDVMAYPDYRIAFVDSGSDGAAIATLARVHGLTLPARAVRARLFHLPTPDHRTELMIIYAETLADTGGVPLVSKRVPLDSAAPVVAHALTQRLRGILTIRTR